MNDFYFKFWFFMARHSKSWVRIFAVDKLRYTNDPNVKFWLLTEGYKNKVSYIYTAYNCLMAGDLLSYLRKPNVDINIINGAGDLISAMIHGTPSEELEDYKDGSEVIRLYLEELFRIKSLDKQNRLNVEKIKKLLSTKPEDKELAINAGYTDEYRYEMLAYADDILGNKEKLSKAI